MYIVDASSWTDAEALNICTASPLPYVLNSTGPPVGYEYEYTVRYDVGGIPNFIWPY